MAITRKPLNETIARNLDRITFFGVWLLSVAFFFSAYAIYAYPINAENIRSTYGIFALIVVFSYMGLFVYNAHRVIPKLKSLSGSAKYNVLKTYSMHRNFFLFSVVLLFGWGIAWSAVVQSGIIQNETLTTFGAIFPSLLFAFAMLELLSYVDIDSWNRSTQADLSLLAIQEYETIAFENSSKRRKVYSGEVWSYCLNRIVNYLEDRFSLVMGTSKNFSKNFYEVFNILSLAALSGDTNQRKKAIEWLEQLRGIIMEKRLPTCTKNRLIMEQLEKAQKEEAFEKFKVAQNDFGFHYDFLSGSKRLNKNWKKSLNLVYGITAIVGLILLIKSALGY